MLLPRFGLSMVLVGIMVGGASVVSGQSYPNKSIRLVTAQPGTGGDFAARLIAQGLAEGVGQQVVVDNRIGVIAAEIVAKAPPDGYTVLLFGGTLWLTPLLQTVPYDPISDFAAVTLAARAPNVLVVNASLPVKSVKELIALAKARPGELNYASSTNASASHLSGELFNSMAGVNIVRIPYKGAGGAAITDLVVGRVQLFFGTAGAVAPHVKSGRLRALAVTSAQPSALFPGLPTVAVAVPGYEMVSMSGMFTPAKTPEAIIKRLNQEIIQVLSRTDMKERFLNGGVEIVGSTPEQLAAAVKSDMSRMGKLIKDAGIQDK